MEKKEIEVALTIVTGSYIRYNDGVVVAEFNSKYAEKIPVVSGEVYLITTSAKYLMACVTEYNASEEYIGFEGHAGSTVTKWNRHEYIVPNGVSYIAICAFQSAISVIKMVYTTIDEKISARFAAADKFMDKSVLFTGDSICNGYGWDYGVVDSDRKAICLTNPPNTTYYNLGWAQVFAENHRGTTVYGYGVNGAKISGTGSISSRMSEMASNADYVVLSGGINDCFKRVAIGEIQSTSSGSASWNNTANFDINTFCGALEQMFYSARVKWGTAKLGFIITPTVPNTYTYTIPYDEYYNAIQNACKKWCIPFLDLAKNGNLTFALSVINNLYTMGDCTHPNELCYRTVIANQVETFMSSL